MANTLDSNRPLNYKSKHIVYSVYEYFLKKKEDSLYLERTAEGTGVSIATVARINLCNTSESTIRDYIRDVMNKIKREEKYMKIAK